MQRQIKVFWGFIWLCIEEGMQLKFGRWKWQIGTVFFCDDRWKLRRRLKLLLPRWLKCVGWKYISGRVQTQFDCDLRCAKSAGRRSPDYNWGWFMLFWKPATIEELECINRSWQYSQMVPSVYCMVCLCDKLIDKRYPYFHPSVEYHWEMHWQCNMCREHLGTFSFFFSDKLVMFCSSAFSPDSSAKTS